MQNLQRLKNVGSNLCQENGERISYYHGVKINAEIYAYTLKRIHVNIKNKRPGKLTNHVILQNDNVALTIQDLLGRIEGEVLQQSP